VDAWRGLALTQLARGETDAYQKTCAESLRRFGQPAAPAVVALLFSPTPGDAWTAASLVRAATVVTVDVSRAQRAVVRTCLLRPDGVAAAARLPPLADSVTRGAVLCRAGRWEEAVQELKFSRDGSSLLYRALAEHHRGRNAEAKKDLEQAVQWLAAPSPSDPQQTNAARLPWDERLEIDLLRREVEALLK
jgi:hypothetical protein